MDGNEELLEVTEASSQADELAEAQVKVRELEQTIAQLETRGTSEQEANQPEPAGDEQPVEPPAVSAHDSETIEGPEETAVCDDTEGQEKEDTKTKYDSEQTPVRDLIADSLAKADRSRDHREEDTRAASDEVPSEELHPTTKLKKRNRALAEENEHLLAQVAELNQQLSGSSAEVQQLTEEKKDLKSQLSEARETSDTLQKDFTAAQDKIEEQGQNLEKRLEEVSTLQRSQQRTKAALQRAERKLEEEGSEKIRLSQQLEAASVENTDLRQKLETEAAQKAKIEQDLGICESARQQLILQIEELQQQERRIRELSGWDTALSLAPVLTKLSTLARLEPQETKGLSERAVFEEFRELLARQAGGRLEAFPIKQEMAGETLWLDPDQGDLADLLERYDWSPDHPFEGLPEGQRRVPFRVAKRGWSVGGRVLARARVVPESMSSDSASQTTEGQASDEPEDS